MRRMAISWVSFVMLIQASPSFGADTICRHFFDNMQKQVNIVLADPKIDFVQKRTELTGIFEKAVDAEWIAHAVTQGYWDKATPQERDEFVKAYRPYLAYHYIGGLDEEDINEMVTLLIVDLNFVTADKFLLHAQVKMKADDPLNFDISLEEQPRSVCHVRDFTMEGVSQVSTQRAEIQSIAADGGLKHVTQKLIELTHSAL